MANWRSFPVSEAITEITADRIVLPVIQRPLVWTEDQMLNLFDSLFMQNSFGSIMCVEELSGSTPLFSCRPFTRDGNSTTANNPERVPQTRMFVIDGQQRLQSFYLGLWGTFRGKSLFFDLFSNYEEYEYNFAFEVSRDKLPVENKDSSLISEHLWYQASLLFSKLAEQANHRIVAKKIAEDEDIKDDSKRRYIEENVRNFYDRIFADTSIGISKVSARLFDDAIKDRERIAELFQRLNHGGTVLTNYDLIFSSLVGINNEMESFFETLESRYASIGINKRVIIRLLYVLTDHPIQNEDNMRDEAAFVAAHRQRIEKTIESLSKFLELSNHARWFASSGKSVIPLYFLAYHIFYQKCNDDQLPHLFDTYDTNPEFNAMLRWLKLSLLNGAFSYGCGWRANTTGMAHIHRIMKNNQGKEFPVSELFKLYAEKLNKFIRKQYIITNNLNKLDEDYMFFLIYGRPRSSVRVEDIDHIHPRSILENAGVSQDLINSFGNFQLLDSETNRHVKRAMEFGDWVQQEVSDKEFYRTEHLIPDDSSLWYSDKFKEFLNSRLQMIADKIKASFNKDSL